MLNRLPTQLMFNLLGGQITFNQERVFNVSNKISTQKNFTHAYEDPAAAVESLAIKTRIAENNQKIRDRVQAKQELEAAESALRGMEGLLQRLREITVAAGNGAFGAEERIAFAHETQSLADAYTQFVNTRVNGNYIFSGQQSNFTTFRLQDGAPLNSGVFKNNQDDSKQRYIDGIPTSVDIKDAIISAASSASFTNGIINPITTVAGDIDFTVDDGNGNITNFTASIGIGDDLSDIISTINTAFIGAGGAGAIAQESPEGYLNMDTALITGNSANTNAKIQVLSSSNSTLTNELHIRKQVNKGKNAGVYTTFETILTALNTNDPETLRGMLDDLDFNMAQVNDLTSAIGLSTTRVENLDSIAENKDIALQLNLSSAQDVDMIKAGLDIANARAALETSISTTSTFFKQTLRDFLR